MIILKTILLDMVWPVLYVSESLSKFWFLVFGTIIIELFVIKRFLKFSWKKSFWVSLIGNCASSLAGIFVMPLAMILWHVVADKYVRYGTFDSINWVATYVLMCLGSVFIETLTIKVFYDEPIKKLFLPMLTGNFLSYVFIAFAATKK